MENTGSAPRRPVNPRRRKRSRMRVFREAYLPMILLVAALILIIAFIVGSVSRSSELREEARQESIANAQSQEAERLRQETEAAQLITEADLLAAGYDYDGAVAKLDSFSGNIYDYDILLNKREQYLSAKETLVEWTDTTEIPNLSFHLLIADPERAFAHKGYGESFKANFVTTTEFSRILKELLENNYILVDMDDIVTVTTTESGTTVYTPQKLYLPAGKKPIMLTQTQVNYYTYMTDGNGDGLPDKGGAGFASKLVADANGNLTCEMVDSTGSTLTGEYDLVPILESFIKAHPNFSYRGARATLAVTGYDGIFGYRTDPETKKKIGEDFYEQQLIGAKTVVEALRQKGYTIACYTYDNEAYGKLKADEIQADLNLWKAEVTPLLGDVDTLVFAKNSDIGKAEEAYSGGKYELLKGAGFTRFLGFCDDSDPWTLISDDYVRQGRLLVTGTSLTSIAKPFSGLFDAKAVLDLSR